MNTWVAYWALGQLDWKLQRDTDKARDELRQAKRASRRLLTAAWFGLDPKGEGEEHDEGEEEEEDPEEEIGREEREQMVHDPEMEELWKKNAEKQVREMAGLFRDGQKAKMQAGRSEGTI